MLMDEKTCVVPIFEKVDFEKKISRRQKTCKITLINSCHFRINIYGRAHEIIRDYLTAFWLLPEVSTRDTIISPRAL